MTQPSTLPEAWGLIAELQERVKRLNSREAQYESAIQERNALIAVYQHGDMQPLTEEQRRQGALWAMTARTQRVATPDEALELRLQELSDEVATLRQELYKFAQIWTERGDAGQAERRRGDALGMALQLMPSAVGQMQQHKTHLEIVDPEAAATALAKAAAVFEAYMAGNGPVGPAPLGGDEGSDDLKRPA